MALKRQYPPHNLSNIDSVKKSEGRGYNLNHHELLAANSDLQVVASSESDPVIGSKRRRVQPFLPYDIVESILSRLPVRSLARFRCVCRHWMSLTDDRNFAMLQHKIAKDNPRLLLHKFVAVNPTTITYYEVLGSSAGGQNVDDDEDEAVLQESSFQASIKDNTDEHNNQPRPRWYVSNPMHGLVCVFAVTDQANNHVYLMNPTTREIAKLPKRPQLMDSGNSSFLLGFNSKSGEYIVAWMYSIPMSESTRCDVLMLGRSTKLTAKWNYVGQVSTEIWDDGEATHVDGMFYWLNRPGDAYEFSVLDTRDEGKFEAKTPPPFTEDGGQCSLGAMGGCLSALKTTYGNEILIEIWTLEDHDTWAWSKVHNINWAEIPPFDHSLVQPVTIVGLVEGETKLLFTLYKREGLSGCNVGPLYCYDLLAKTFKKYSDEVCLSLQVHAESLRSPTKLLTGGYRLRIGSTSS